MVMGVLEIAIHRILILDSSITYLTGVLLLYLVCAVEVNMAKNGMIKGGY